jgi:hypothetical protein
VPWAQRPETSLVTSIEDYRQALEAAGFRIEHQRDRRQFAMEFMERMKTQAASAIPALGVQLLMGEHAPLMLKNVTSAIAAGALEPVELVAVAG